MGGATWLKLELQPKVSCDLWSVDAMMMDLVDDFILIQGYTMANTT